MTDTQAPPQRADGQLPRGTDTRHRRHAPPAPPGPQRHCDPAARATATQAAALPCRCLGPAPAAAAAQRAPPRADTRDPAGQEDHRSEARKAAPGDRARSWLSGAMVALAVLAAAAAVVSWDAQYMLVLAVKRRPGRRRAGGGHPGRGRADLRGAGHRAGAARPAGDPAPGAERGLRRDQPGDERAGRRAGLAGPGDLGHARRGLRAGVRHADRRRPRLGGRPDPRSGQALADDDADADGDRRRPRCCGCCAWSWRRRRRSPGSAAGRWTSARSRPAARPCHPAPLRPRPATPPPRHGRPPAARRGRARQASRTG